MGWEYRISKEIRTHKYLHYDPKIVYGIRQVHVNENGEVDYNKANPLFIAETLEELKDNIQEMMNCFDKPIFDEYEEKE